MNSFVLGDTEVKIVKKRIKNMYLRIDREGNATLSAPVGISDSVVKGFLLSKEEWLKKALHRISENAKNSKVGSLFNDGETRTLLGESYTLYTDTTRGGGYYFRGKDIVICVGENSTAEMRKKVLAEVYRDAMNEVLPEIFEKCQKKCGIYANEWRLKNMKTRWGSCNTKERRIWINVWLVEKAPICIEAVVYHELAHLKHSGHTKAFYNYLERICPFYRKAESLLKKR